VPLNFGIRVKSRGLGIDSYDAIRYLYDEIEHPLTELTKFVKREPSEILSDKSAIVFYEALKSYFDELRQIAREIDDEYAAPPKPVVQPERPDVQVVLKTNVIGK
jgi:hypothetical protein